MKVIKCDGEDFTGEAPMVAGDGNVTFKLWINEEGGLHVQLKKQEKGGACSNLLFSVSEFSEDRKSGGAIERPRGYDLATNEYKFSNNTVDPGFLKAVLQHLLP